MTDRIIYVDKTVGSKFTVSDANSIKDVVNQHASSIDNVTGDIDTINTRVTYLEGSSGGGDITALTNSLDTVSGQVDINVSDINTISGRVDSLEGGGGGSSTDTATAISNGTVSGYYDNSDQFRYNHHLIPESNANYDLGNAEYKIRHLFLSDNSLWIGDENKIDTVSGIMQTKQRDKTKLPHYIETVLGGDESSAIAHASAGSLSDLTLQDLESYAQTLNPTATLSTIFPPEDDQNYRKDDFKDIFQQRSKINEINPLPTDELIALDLDTTIIDIKSNSINNTFFIDGNQALNIYGNSTFDFINVPEVDGFQYQGELVFLDNLSDTAIFSVNVNGVPAQLIPSSGTPEGGDGTPGVGAWSNPSGIIGVRLYKRQTVWYAFLIKM